VVAVVASIVVIGSLASVCLVDSRFIRYGLLGMLLLLLAFTLNFFRDPERITPPGDNLIISPADGKVVLIKNVREDECFNMDAVQVSIFMSPFNVHVNRYPINGKVEYFRYFSGEYLMAFDEKSSLRNERTHIGVSNTHTKVLFKQIAGFVARRIVANVQVGDATVAGARFGMIKFGSRVDIILPRKSELKVKLGDTAAAGETIIAVVS
jgi:phosphatidylserine decarboxylase